MNKMKIIFIATASLFIAMACGKKNDLSIDEDQIEMDEMGYETHTVSVKGEDWNFEVSDDWLKVEKKSNQLILSAAMYVSETGPRTASISIQSKGSTERKINVEQENIFVGKMAQGGLIYWLNPEPEKVKKGGVFPDCAGLVLALDETPRMKEANYVVLDQENHVEIRREFREKMYAVDLAGSTDGMLLTKTYLGVIESFKGRLELPPKEECTNPIQHFGNPLSWFVEEYWQKEVEGYSDWYIPSFEELKPVCDEGPTPKDPGKVFYAKLNSILEKEGATKMAPLYVEDQPSSEESAQGNEIFWSYLTLSDGRPYTDSPAHITQAKQSFRILYTEIRNSTLTNLADPKHTTVTFETCYYIHSADKVGFRSAIRPIRRF